MSTFIRCDGCGIEVVPHHVPARTDERLAIQGERVGGLAGGGLDLSAGARFHWCLLCARVAFMAVKDQRGVAK